MVDNYEIDGEDLILLLIDAAERLLGVKELRGVTRLEKLLYLLSKEQKVDAVEKFYNFKPYKFGPFSKEVYQSTEYLMGLDLLNIAERPVSSYYSTANELELDELIDDLTDEHAGITDQREKVYALTESGRLAAKNLREIWREKYGADLEKLEYVVRRFGKLPLNKLIRYVYSSFPASAANSIHPEANNISR